MKIDSKELIIFLLNRKLIKRKELTTVLYEWEKGKKSLKEILLQKKLVSEKNLKRAEAYVLGASFVDLSRWKILTEVLKLVPEPIAQKNKIVAFAQEGNKLKVAMLDFSAIQAIDFIRKKVGFKIVPYLASINDLNFVLQRYHKILEIEFTDIIGKEVTVITGKLITQIKNDPSQKNLEEIVQGLPVIKMTEALLKHAVLQLASDIYIESEKNKIKIKYRINGILYEVTELAKEVFPILATRFRILSNLKLAKHHMSQIGYFKEECFNEKVSFQVFFSPTLEGEKISIRILNESTKGLTFEQMGLSGLSLERLYRVIKKPQGIILVVGPAGSGKTTTLYTAMDILNQPEVNIISIEDPITHRMSKINQTQVKLKMGMTFSRGVKALLQQDVDIIMVGEIRDEETMGLVMDAGMTGHLILTSLPVNSVVATIARILDMGLEESLVASTVKVIVAQRLVRKICQNCKKTVTYTKKEQRKLFSLIDQKKLLDKLRKESKFDSIKIIEKIKNREVKFFYGAGCKHCNNQGYKGKIGIFEVLKISKNIKKMINNKPTMKEIEKAVEKEGIITIMEDGIIKAIKGETTIEEVIYSLRV